MHQNTYLVNLETLEVLKVRYIDNKTYYNEIEDYLYLGWKRTTSEIYRRFKKGFLSLNSFKEYTDKNNKKRITNTY